MIIYYLQSTAAKPAARQPTGGGAREDYMNIFTKIEKCISQALLARTGDRVHVPEYMYEVLSSAVYKLHVIAHQDKYSGRQAEYPEPDKAEMTAKETQKYYEDKYLPWLDAHSTYSSSVMAQYAKIAGIHEVIHSYLVEQGKMEDNHNVNTEVRYAIDHYSDILEWEESVVGPDSPEYDNTGKVKLMDKKVLTKKLTARDISRYYEGIRQKLLNPMVLLVEEGELTLEQADAGRDIGYTNEFIDMEYYEYKHDIGIKKRKDAAVLLNREYENGTLVTCKSRLAIF